MIYTLLINRFNTHTRTTYNSIKNFIEEIDEGVKPQTLPPVTRKTKKGVRESNRGGDDTGHDDSVEKKSDDVENRKCKICNRVFTKEIHMRNHLPVHDANRPKYTCSYPDCTKQYNDLKNWRPHFLNNHTEGTKGDSVKTKKLKKFEEEMEKVKNGLANKCFLKRHFLMTEA